MPNTQQKRSCSQADKHAWLLSTIVWLSYTVDLIEFWTFFFLSLDSQWVWHYVPCLDILGRRSCCLANLPHWTGKMGSNERWDWKVSFVGLILVNVKWNSYPDFSLSPHRSAARSLFREEEFQGKPLGTGYEIVDICLSVNSQVSTWAPHLNSSVFQLPIMKIATTHSNVNNPSSTSVVCGKQSWNDSK